ncbi:hypothetical protein [Capnocytophaga canis]|uniref:hypothetical protein n=1 Tax=Capnocytophaga canis TaxID=1848903 RepID=UPI001561C3FA|nr:hypothetical protein [Capnocytophaga canis]
MPITEILKQNYSGKQVQSLAELTRETELQMPSLKEMFDIVPNIKGKQEVGYIGGLEKITRKDEGCGSQGMSVTPPSRKVLWNPIGFKVHIEECYKDWMNTWLEWGLKNGIKKQDLTTDEYFLFLTDLIGEAIQKDFFRYVLFGNKNHSVVNSGSGTEVLTAGENPVNFNLMDGLFAKMDAFGTANASKRYTITANNGANFTAQRNLGADEGMKIAEFLLDNADGRMFGQGADPYIFMTWSLSQNLKRYMRETYKNEMTFSKVEGGFEISEFDGVRLVTHRYIDHILRRDFSNGTKWDRPHRAFLLDRNNERIGVDSESSFTDIEAEYIGGRDEKNHIKASYLADYQRPYQEFAVVAY